MSMREKAPVQRLVLSRETLKLLVKSGLRAGEPATSSIPCMLSKNSSTLGPSEKYGICPTDLCY